MWREDGIQLNLKGWYEFFTRTILHCLHTPYSPCDFSSAAPLIVQSSTSDSPVLVLSIAPSRSSPGRSFAIYSKLCILITISLSLPSLCSVSSALEFFHALGRFPNAKDRWWFNRRLELGVDWNSGSHPNQLGNLRKVIKPLNLILFIYQMTLIIITLFWVGRLMGIKQLETTPFFGGAGRSKLVV